MSNFVITEPLKDVGQIIKYDIDLWKDKYFELEKNSVPISLIEKKIEDYKERKRYYEDENLVYDDEYYSYEIIIQVLQELLDERSNTDE